MKYYLPAISCAIIIFVLSTRASVSLPFSWNNFLSTDKIGHAMAYGALTLSCLWGIQKDTKHLSRQQSFWVVGLCSAYGILLEVIQYSFFPNRYFEVLDILANIIGAFVALYIFRKWLL